MLILVGFVRKSELWLRFTPISHRYARLWSPCAAFVWVVYLMNHTANYGNRYAHHGSGPGISPPILMLFKYLARFPMPSGYLTWSVNVPNAQTRGGIDTLYGTFRLFMPPPAVPKIKMAHTTSSLWLCVWLLQQIMSIALPTKWVKAS